MIEPMISTVVGGVGGSRIGFGGSLDRGDKARSGKVSEEAK